LLVVTAVCSLVPSFGNENVPMGQNSRGQV